MEAVKSLKNNNKTKFIGLEFEVLEKTDKDNEP